MIVYNIEAPPILCTFDSILLYFGSVELRRYVLVVVCARSCVFHCNCYYTKS